MIILLKNLENKIWILEENEKIEISSSFAGDLKDITQLFEKIKKFEIIISEPFMNNRGFPAVDLLIESKNGAV